MRIANYMMTKFAPLHPTLDYRS